MQIEIVKSSRNDYWYTTEIGNRFEVTGAQEDIYEVRKWIEFPTKYAIAPVLREDCKILFVEKKYQDFEINNDWRIRQDRIDREGNLRKRSGHNTRKEIEHYEHLNKNVDIKIYKIKDE